jgi:hypothetical protein
VKSNWIDIGSLARDILAGVERRRAEVGERQFSVQDGAADGLRDLREDGIAVGGDAAVAQAGSQPGGAPIIHSTRPSSSARRCKTGEAAVPVRPSAPEVSESGREFRSIVSGEARSDRLSRAVGVGSNPVQAPAHFAMAGLAMLPLAVGVSRVAMRSLAHSEASIGVPPRLAREEPIGVGIMHASDGRIGPSRPAAPPRLLPYSEALGVRSNDPDPISSVRGAGMSSTHHERPDGVADRLQISRDPVIASSSEARHVLKRAPSRSDFVDEADGFKEQSGPCTVDPLTFGVGGAGVLAGWASDDNLGQVSEVVHKSNCVEASDIVVKPHAGEVAAEHLAPPQVDLAGSDGSEAGSMQAKRPAANGPTKQIQHHQRGRSHAGPGQVQGGKPTEGLSDIAAGPGDSAAHRTAPNWEDWI